MILRSSSASVCCRVARCACVIPALLTQMSTRPSFSCANLASESTSSACTSGVYQHASYALHAVASLLEAVGVLDVIGSCTGVLADVGWPPS